MELDDLRIVPLIVLTCKGIEWENSNQSKEWNCLNVTKRKRTFSAYSIRISEFRMNSKYHGRRRGEI